MKVDENRLYGVEIEVSRLARAEGNPLEIIADALRSEGFEARVSNYGSADQRYGGAWKVMPDASAGPEIVSPPLRGVGGLTQIAEVCAVLKNLYAVTTASCGLHVHHSARDLTIEEVFRLTALYSLHQDAINSILPRSRRNNFYAKPLEVPSTGGGMYEEKALKSRLSEYRGKLETCDNVAFDRYFALNWRAYRSHGTVEFRQHSGTINARKIAYWILLTQGLVSAAKARGTEVAIPAYKEHSLRSKESHQLAQLWRTLAPVMKNDVNWKAMKDFYRTRMVNLAGSDYKAYRPDLNRG